MVNAQTPDQLKANLDAPPPGGGVSNSSTPDTLPKIAPLSSAHVQAVANQMTAQRMPSVEQMASQVNHNQAAPAAAANQTANPTQGQIPDQNLSQTPNLAGSPATGNKSDQTATAFHKSHNWLRIFFQKPFHNSIAIWLTIQGILGIYQSIQFILVGFPELESRLAANLINQDQVNQIATHAVTVVFSTALSMFFALRITFLKGQTAKKINTVVAILLIVGNTFLLEFFGNFPLAEHWSRLVALFIVKLENIIAKF